MADKGRRKDHGEISEVGGVKPKVPRPGIQATARLTTTSRDVRDVRASDRQINSEHSGGGPWECATCGRANSEITEQKFLRRARRVRPCIQRPASMYDTVTCFALLSSAEESAPSSYTCRKSFVLTTSKISPLVDLSNESKGVFLVFTLKNRLRSRTRV